MTYPQLVEKSLLSMGYGYEKVIEGSTRDTIMATIKELQEQGIEKKHSFMLEVNGFTISKFPTLSHAEVMAWDEQIKKRGNAQEENVAYFKKKKK